MPVTGIPLPLMSAGGSKRMPLARAGSTDALGRLLGAYRNYLLRIARQEMIAALVPSSPLRSVVPSIATKPT